MRKYFLPYMILETIFVAGFIWKYGFLALMLEIILSVVAGLVLISKFGLLDIIREVRKPNSIFGNFGVAAGGMMLMFPGILSDTIGIAIIIITLVIKFINKDSEEIKEKNSNNTYNYTYCYTQSSSKESSYDDIIDVEIVEENSKIKN